MTDEKFYALQDKVQGQLIGAKFLGCIRMGEILQEITGMEATCYDQYIDDGADGDETEDQYVMCASYQFKEEPNVTVRIYYGDVSGEIGYVDLSES